MNTCVILFCCSLHVHHEGKLCSRVVLTKGNAVFNCKVAAGLLVVVGFMLFWVLGCFVLFSNLMMFCGCLDQSVR